MVTEVLVAALTLDCFVWAWVVDPFMMVVVEEEEEGEGDEVVVVVVVVDKRLRCLAWD